MKTVRPINKNLLPQSFWHGTQPMNLQVLHDTGNYLRGDSAVGNRNYWFNQNNGISAHAIIDKTQIMETLPYDQKGWHVGGAGNVNSWGVELCNLTTQADFDSQIDDCARYFAQVRFDHMAGVDVTKDNLKSHHECNQTMKTGSDHVDPDGYLAHYGWNMDKFRAKVQQYLNELKKPVTPPAPTPTTSNEMYRVRKTWEDVKSQIGAFGSLENAKAKCNQVAGYHVYNSAGQLVYPIPTPPPAPVEPEKIYGVVTASVLNVRSSREIRPDNIIGTLNKGEKVRIDHLMGDWYSIYYGSHGGFVSAQYLQKV